MVKKIENFFNGNYIKTNNKYLQKINPHNNQVLSEYPNTGKAKIDKVVNFAKAAQIEWAEKTAINRSDFLLTFVKNIEDNKDILINISAEETGKSIKDSTGEVDAAIRQGYYWATEGYRFFSNTMSSQTPKKVVYSVRDPLGVALLIVPANTAVANIAWKLFPALLCGNSVILKSSEDAPETADFFAKISIKSQFPKGVFNLIHGGRSTAKNLVDADIDIVSFTGSSSTGIKISQAASLSLKRFSLELGGSNALIVMSDADIENALNWAVQSSFSNAGQRCAASSHIFVEDKIFKSFKKNFINKTKNLTMGIEDDNDIGPLITKRQQLKIRKEIVNLKKTGAIIDIGGNIPKDKNLKNGNYIEPTIISNIPKNNTYLNEELFAPVTSIYSFSSLNNVINLINSSMYGLTAAIHTKDISTAFDAASKIKTGVFNINSGTHGSEPHMSFGGTKHSGNGTREPGIFALDVYSEIKNITIKY